MKRIILLSIALFISMPGIANVHVSECMADNDNTLLDVDGDSSDWIELYNSSSTIADLSGWHLTDTATNLTRWTLPSITIPAKGFLIVFASDKDRALAGAELHTNFKLNASGEYIALTHPDGITVESQFTFPAQLEDVSYGYGFSSGSGTSTVTFIDLSGTGMLEAPTPGAPNTSINYIGYCVTPAVGPQRGFYDTPFQVSITNVTEGATVRYTTDGSVPTESNGTVYSGPVTIDHTTLLRAAAVKTGHRSSVPNTQTYLFVDEVLRQDGTGLQPYAWWGDYGPDWEIDPSMTNSLITDFDSQPFRLADALLDIPTVSLVTDWDNWWSDAPGPTLPDAAGTTPSQGIYVDTIAMHADRRPVSMEFFTADGSEMFAENGRISIVGGGIGGSSAVRWKSDKLSMRVAFDGKLNHNVFGEDAAQTFNGLFLDAHLAWVWTHSGKPWIGATPKFFSDALASDIQNSMSNGRGAPHSRFVHLYLNGLYWGMFDMHERPDEHFAAEYYGGTNEDYDSVKHLYDDIDPEDSDFDGLPYNDNITGGDDANLHAMFALARADLSQQSNYDALAAVLDIEDLIDYLLMNFYLGNTDWAHKNWYATYNRNDPDGRWRYHSWDTEHIIEKSFFDADLPGALAIDVTGWDIRDIGGPTELHRYLSNDSAEYRLQFADHVHRHFFNEGILTVDNVMAAFWTRVREIDRAMLGEAARWADNKDYLGHGDYDYSNWFNHIVDLRDTYFPYRHGVVMSQLQSRNLYPSTVAPEFAVNGAPMHGGRVAPSDSITIDSVHAVYYTSDGSDPRAVGGAVAGLEYSTPLSFSKPTLLKARAKKGNEWSALCEAVFWTEDLPLAVTELMYHASGSNRQDFIEIQNISDETVVLDGYKLDGAIDYHFRNSTTTSLAPGEFLVVIKDLEQFSSAYSTNGISIAGEYKGDLDNGGEKVELKFWNKDLITFRYSDARNWPQAADGAGHSLVPLASALDDGERGLLDYGGNWRASTYIGGSPGYADPVPDATVLLNEITAHTDTGGAPPFESNDKIELYNPTAFDMVLNGWHLSDDLDEPDKWAIPNGTVITSHGFILFDEDDFHPDRVAGFGLDKAGEQVLLSAPGRVVDAIRFKGQYNGVSLGRYPDGSPHWLATLPTPGQTNQPVTASLQISELMYHPLLPGGNEMEYIQIKNVGVSTALFSNSTGSYRIDGGVSYTFPAGVSLAPEEALWLVSFNPAVETALLAQFRSTYGLSTSDPVYGPYKGELSNCGERVALERPQDSDDPLLPLDVSWAVVDELFYFDQAPWPTTADGDGNPLIRTGLSSWSVPQIPGIGVSETDLYQLVRSGQTPPDDTIEIWNKGLSTLHYSISTDVSWLSALPASGSSTGEHASVTLDYDLMGVVAGTYTGRVEVSSTNAFNSPRNVEVMLEVYEPELDHFSWEPVGTNQHVNQPFAASLTAFDQYGSILSSFTDSVSIAARGGGLLRKFKSEPEQYHGNIPWRPTPMTPERR